MSLTLPSFFAPLAWLAAWSFLPAPDRYVVRPLAELAPDRDGK